MSFFIPKPKALVSGVGCIVMSPDSKKVFLVEGDRHLWPEGVEDLYKALFHGAAPGQVITVKAFLNFLGKEYTPAEFMGAIVEWCVSKGYFPKSCFTEEAAVEIAKDSDDYAYTVQTSQLLAFHSELMQFTDHVADHHYQENVFGAVDGGPTMDVDTIRDTLYREGHEEFNLPLELLRNAQFLRYGKPRQNKSGETVVTAYFVVWVNEQEMLEAWQTKMICDRPTCNEWRCMFSWFKFLGGIDVATAKNAKAHLETGPSGDWHPVGVHPNMDRKNRALIELYAAMRAEGSAPPKRASQRSLGEAEPAAKRQREMAEPSAAAAWGYDPSVVVPLAPAPPARASGSLGGSAASPQGESEASAAKADINVRMFGSRSLPEPDPAGGLDAPEAGLTGESTKMKLHLMVNNGSVSPLLPQGDETKLPSHPVPIGAEGEYMGERAVVTYYDETLPSQYAPAGHECLLTVAWEGGRVRIPKRAFLREGTGLMWVLTPV